MTPLGVATLWIARSTSCSTMRKGKISPKVGGDLAYAAYMSEAPNTTKSDLPDATSARFFLVAPKRTRWYDDTRNQRPSEPSQS